MLISSSLIISSSSAAHAIPPEPFDPQESSAGCGCSSAQKKSSGPDTWRWAILAIFAAVALFLIRKFGGKGKPPPSDRPLSGPIPSSSPIRQPSPSRISRLFSGSAALAAQLLSTRFDPDVGMPNIYKVRAQITQLIEDGHFPQIRENTSDEYDHAILYAAHMMIEKWDTAVTTYGVEVVAEYKTAGHVYNGTLPISFILEKMQAEFPPLAFVIRNLKPFINNWIREARSRFVSVITATVSFEKVRRQLVDYFPGTNNPKHLDFLAREAIKEWRKSDQKNGLINVVEETPEGGLPPLFMRVFANGAGPRKLEELRLSWLRVPEPLTPSFGPAPIEDSQPDLFIDVVMSLEEEQAFEDLLVREDAAFQLSDTPSIYNGEDLTLVMHSLVRKNSELAHYPRLLEKIAKVRIDLAANSGSQSSGPRESDPSANLHDKIGSAHNARPDGDVDGELGGTTFHESLYDDFSSPFVVGAEELLLGQAFVM